MSDWYGVRDAACPLSTRGGGGGCAQPARARWAAGTAARRRGGGPWASTSGRSGSVAKLFELFSARGAVPPAPPAHCAATAARLGRRSKPSAHNPARVTARMARSCSRRSPRTKWTRRVPHPVLIGHAAPPISAPCAQMQRRAARGGRGARGRGARADEPRRAASCGLPPRRGRGRCGRGRDGRGRRGAPGPAVRRRVALLGRFGRRSVLARFGRRSVLGCGGGGVRPSLRGAAPPARQRRLNQRQNGPKAAPDLAKRGARGD